MRVEIGPVPSESARAWMGYARDVLAARRAHDAQTLPDDARERFDAFLDEWAAAAAASDELRIEVELDPEVLEYLVHLFYRVATRLAEEVEHHGAPLAPPEGDAFYRTLVDSLLLAMTESGGSRAQFADELRPFWPRLR